MSRRVRMVLTSALVALGACSDDVARAGTNGVPWSADPAAWRATLPVAYTPLGVGTPADSARIAAWDFDVDSAGHGLPAGRGSVEQGGALYAAKCAMCHGPQGEGALPAYPRLVDTTWARTFDFARDPAVVRTVGNYWPHATTLYDYIQRAMPYTAPGSLTADETYALTAWILAANGLVPRDAVLDSAALVRVKMPGAGRFIDDARGR